MTLEAECRVTKYELHIILVYLQRTCISNRDQCEQVKFTLQFPRFRTEYASVSKEYSSRKT